MTCNECVHLRAVGCDLVKMYCDKIELIIPEPDRMFCNEGACRKAE